MPQALLDRFNDAVGGLLNPGKALLEHFHVPVCRNCGTYTYLNPGSVSLPKENSPHSCLLIEDATLTWYDLESGKAFQPME